MKALTTKQQAGLDLLAKLNEETTPKQAVRAAYAKLPDFSMAEHDRPGGMKKFLKLVKELGKAIDKL